MNRTSSAPRAFTLIELLVVIAIIAILAAILFPVFARAKESAQITTGVSNFKQMGTAFQLYLNDNEDRLPFGGIASRLIDEPSVGSSEWQVAVYPYVKSEGVYRIPGDKTTAPRGLTDCARTVSTRVTQYSATSFLTNFNISYGVSLPNGRVTRESPPLSTYTEPSSFVLLMHGQRPVIAGIGTGARYNANPRDPFGEACSVWLAIYSQTNEGGVNHLMNPEREADGNSVPHLSRGLIFGMLDSSARFYPIDRTRLPERQLEGRLPWCKHGRANASDPTCRQTWNTADSF